MYHRYQNVITRLSAVATLLYISVFISWSNAQRQEHPSGKVFENYPALGSFVVEGNVRGVLVDYPDGIKTSIPWECYNGNSVHVYGYTDYDQLVGKMNDTDYMPYKTKLEGYPGYYGILTITIVKYTESSTGPYDEIVFNTPVTKGKTRIVTGCGPDDFACLLRDTILYPDFMWFTLKMWLSEELPVATGVQMFGINKSLADTLDISIADKSGGVFDWDVTLKDEKTDTELVASCVESPTAGGEWIQQMMQFTRAVNEGTDDEGNRGAGFSWLGDTFGAMGSSMRNMQMVQPKGIYPEIFGTEINPVIYSVLDATVSEHGKSLDGCNLKIEIKGDYGALQFRPTGCYFQRGLDGTILAPTNEKSFIEGIKNRTTPFESSSLGR